MIFPGGGYFQLSPHEGVSYAEAYTKEGFTCFVVTYRLGVDGFRHPAMLEDALAAMAAVRAYAEDWGCRPDQIGAVGSSAGGHLVGLLMTETATSEQYLLLRPQFVILAYPVVTLEPPYGHKGSREFLLGENADRELVRKACIENLITPEVPPCFVWHTVADHMVPVENSLLLARCLRDNGVPFDLRIYSRGAHGVGLATRNPWFRDSVQFALDLFD